MLRRHEPDAARAVVVRSGVDRPAADAEVVEVAADDDPLVFQLRIASLEDAEHVVGRGLLRLRSDVDLDGGAERHDTLGPEHLLVVLADGGRQAFELRLVDDEAVRAEEPPASRAAPAR